LFCQVYPFAEWPKLRVMGLYLVGLTLFNDEFDRKIDPNVADQASELTLANKYRQRHVSYVGSIFLGDSASKGHEIRKATPIRGFFATVAPHILRAASHSVIIPQLLTELQFFMGSSNEEQQRYTTWRKFPTLQQYNDFRRSTVAVDAICDLRQYALPQTSVSCSRSDLPHSLTLKTDLWQIPSCLPRFPRQISHNHAA